MYVKNLSQEESGIHFDSLNKKNNNDNEYQGFRESLKIQSFQLLLSKSSKKL